MADDAVNWLGCFCPLVFLIAISAADNPVLICGAPNYDVRNLTASIWKFTVPSSECLKSHNASAPFSGCEIQMGFCKEVGGSGNCSSASVCESSSDGNFTYSLGKKLSQPFNTTAAVAGQGFQVNTGDGDAYLDSENRTCHLRTVMTFQCNKSAAWPKGLPGDIVTVPVNPDILFDPRTCVYNVTFNFAGACPMSYPASPDHILSPGSVLLLIFFVSLIMYFALGSLVNTARGKHGEDVVPHLKFWTSLPVYIVDGCEFSLSCGRRHGGQKYESI